MQSGLRLEGVTAQAGGFRLGPISAAVPAGQRLWLLGPTGSGKSLLLQVIAGVVPQTAGQLTWNGTAFGDWPPEARASGWAPQDALLFPHLNGRQNVAFGAPRQPAAGPEWEALVAALQIGALLLRAPRELSGGEQQRLALARALWRRPNLLLLDEPLSALGPDWRGRLDELLSSACQRGAVVVETGHHAPPAAAAANVLRLAAGRMA